MGDASWEEARKQPGLRSLCVHTSGKRGHGTECLLSLRLMLLHSMQYIVRYCVVYRCSSQGVPVCSTQSARCQSNVLLCIPHTRACLDARRIAVVPAWTQDRMPHRDAENMQRPAAPCWLEGSNRTSWSGGGKGEGRNGGSS